MENDISNMEKEVQAKTEKIAEEIPAMKELEADDEFKMKFQEALGMPEGL